MIELKQVSRSYGNVLAVDGLSFEIPKGQIVGLLGHNGAGKTTTLKMITGYLEPSSGSLHIDGMDMRESRLQIQTKLGYLPENAPLYPEMTVGEYLCHAGRLKGVEEEVLFQSVRQALGKTKLSEKISQKIGTLSKGYRQRVGVAQALLNDPTVLVLDEPTNGLDPSQILEMRQLIIELSRKSTIILSTHILQEVEAVCDRVIIILNGHVAEDSLLSGLDDQYAYECVVNMDEKKTQEILRAHSELKSFQCCGGEAGHFVYRFTIPYENDGRIPQMVAALAHAGQLYEFAPRKNSLENVFRHVNGGSYVQNS